MNDITVNFRLFRYRNSFIFFLIRFNDHSVESISIFLIFDCRYLWTCNRKFGTIVLNRTYFQPFHTLSFISICKNRIIYNSIWFGWFIPLRFINMQKLRHVACCISLCRNFSCALSLHHLLTSQHFIFYAFCNINNVTVYLNFLEARANESYLNYPVLISLTSLRFISADFYL